MKAYADEGRKAGYKLYCNPAILMTLYQTRTIADTRRLFSQKQAPARLTPNEKDPNLPDIKLMGAWTRDNLSWLESAVGKPANSECPQPKGYSSLDSKMMTSIPNAPDMSRMTRQIGSQKPLQVIRILPKIVMNITITK